MIYQTIEKLTQLRLHAMVRNLEQQNQSSHYDSLSFQERLAQLVESQWLAKENGRLARRLRVSGIKHLHADIEAIEEFEKE